MLLLGSLSSGTTWGLPSCNSIELGPQHLSILGSTLESSYAGWVCYYEAGDLQILRSKNLRENVGILRSNEDNSPVTLTEEFLYGPSRCERPGGRQEACLLGSTLPSAFGSSTHVGSLLISF